MKKWFCALGMMLALLMSVALADGVKVTFAEKNGQINGGYDYTMKLNVSPASDKDLTVSLTCDGLDGAYSVVIPAGQKSTTLTVPTQVVEERGKVVFELQSGDGYTGAGKHTLTIQRLPNVQFYLGINFGTVGKKMSVRMTVTNSSTIVKGNNTFQPERVAGRPLCGGWRLPDRRCEGTARRQERGDGAETCRHRHGLRFRRQEHRSGAGSAGEAQHEYHLLHDGLFRPHVPGGIQARAGGGQ